MKTDRHKRLLDSSDAPFVVKGLRSRSIKEPPIPLRLNSRDAGDFHGIELFEQVAGENAYPQTVADLVCNTFLRLSYQKKNGTSATFGSSIVGTPSFRSEDGVFHFIPRVSEADALVDLRAEAPHRLQVRVVGVFDDLAVVSSTRTYSTPSRIGETTVTVQVQLTALKDIKLSRTLQGSDSFRLFSLSSMYACPDRYDANSIRHGETITDLGSISRRPGYLFHWRQCCSAFELLKMSGSRGARRTPGSPDSPSIRARVVESSVPLDELGIQGYLTESVDANDDSLSVWIEWNRCPAVIPRGGEIAATVEFAAFPPAAD